MPPHDTDANPTVVPDTAADKDAERAAVERAQRRARRRILNKLIAVGVALVAFAALKGIEHFKKSYDEERSKPIVIVDDDYALKYAPPAPGATPAPGVRPTPNAVLLPVSEVQAYFDAAAPAGEKAVLSAELRDDLKLTVNKLKYQNFNGEGAILDRLTEEILAAAEFGKKAVLASEETKRKALASRLIELEQERLTVNAALRDKYFAYESKLNLEASQKEKEDEYKKWESEKRESLIKQGRLDTGETEVRAWRVLLEGRKFAPPGGAEKAPAAKPAAGARGRGAGRPEAKAPAAGETLGVAELLRWRIWIDEQKADEGGLNALREKIKSIDAAAQAQVSAVYFNLKPNLGDLIETSPGAAPKAAGAATFFNPFSIFDQNSGVYAVYQTVWLACVVVIVFAIIFLLMLIMRPLPYFSQGRDSLLGQVGDVFKRPEGATPQLARSLAVTAAALGVGTAVAVAGGGAVAKRPILVAGETYDEQSEEGVDGPRARVGRPGRAGGAGRDGRPGLPGAGGVVEHKVTLAPLELKGPESVTLDPDSMEEIKSALAGLDRGGVVINRGGMTDAELRAMMSSAVESAMTARLGGVDVRKLGERTGTLEERAETLRKEAETSSRFASALDTRLKAAEGGFTSLETWRTTFAADMAKNVGDLKEMTDAAKEALVELRDNAYERRNSGGRGLRTAISQLVRGDRYLVTHQSYRALWSLMCPSEPGSPCHSVNCSRNCSDAEVAAILNALKAQIGKPPVSEGALFEKLTSHGFGLNENLLKKWKRVILKYTRVGY